MKKTLDHFHWFRYLLAGVFISVALAPQFYAGFYANLAMLRLVRGLNGTLCGDGTSCLLSRIVVAPDQYHPLLLPEVSAEVVPVLQKAVAARPTSSRPNSLLGWVLLNQGRPERAEPYLRAGLDNATDRSPSRADLHNRLGDSLLAQGQSGVAAQEYGLGLAASVADTPAHVDSLAGLLLTGDELDASIIESGRKAVAQMVRDRNSIGAYILAELGRYFDATTYLRLATVLPAHRSDLPGTDLALIHLAGGKNAPAVAHYDLGRIAQQEGRLSEAAGHYEAALARESDYPDALYRLGQIYRMLNQPEAAARYLEQCLAQNPMHTGCAEEQAERSTGDGGERQAQSRDGLRLGPNAIPNGDLEQELVAPRRGRLWYRWTQEYATTAQFGEGIFVGERTDFDSYQGRYSVHLAGLWAERNAGHGVQLAELTLEPHSAYLLRFAYKTDDGPGRPVVFVPLTPKEPQRDLPYSHYQWRTYSVVLENPAEATIDAALSFRIWGEVELWVDDISFQKMLDRPQP